MAENNPAKRQKSDSSAESVFVYTGRGCSVPIDVVRVQFDASVVEVSNDDTGVVRVRFVPFDASVVKVFNDALYDCRKLREVVLN